MSENAQNRKNELKARVDEFAPAKDLSTKGEHQQKRKCSQCGKGYLGQQNSDTCGPTCRKRKSRA